MLCQLKNNSPISLLLRHITLLFLSCEFDHLDTSHMWNSNTVTSSCYWLFTLYKQFLRFLLFLFISEFLPFSGWVIFCCMYIPRFIYPSISRYLTCFCLLSLVTDAVLNYRVCKDPSVSCFYSFGHKYPERALLYHVVVLF